MTGPIVLRTVRTGGDLRAFVDLPYRLHRADPHWVPRLRWETRRQLSRTKNPFFQHAHCEYFLALQNTVVIGRIAAIHNHAHNAFHDDRVGFFGLLDSVDDQEVATTLFDAAARWLRERGLTTMRGPMSLSTNDECGLLVSGFDTPPTLMNPHNPPYYARLVESAGFVKAKDLYQYRISDGTMPHRLDRAQLIGERQRITVRPINMKRFDEELERIKLLYNRAWRKNWGFVPMTDAEIDHLAAQLKPVVVPDLVVFAERDGEPVGFAVALPDLNAVLKSNASGRLLPGVIRLLTNGRGITRIRILLLGVIEEQRLTGTDALMCRWIWHRAQALGYRWAEAGWILDGNHMMRNALVRMGFEEYKILRIYDRTL